MPLPKLDDESFIQKKILDVIRESIAVIAEEELRLAKERIDKRGKEVCVAMSVEMMKHFDVSVGTSNMVITFRDKTNS